MLARCRRNGGSFVISVFFLSLRIGECSPTIRQARSTPVASFRALPQLRGKIHSFRSMRMRAEEGKYGAEENEKDKYPQRKTEFHQKDPQIERFTPTPGSSELLHTLGLEFGLNLNDIRAKMKKRERDERILQPKRNKMARKRNAPISPSRSTPANMDLLRHQNRELWEEFHWAQSIPSPQAGDLLLRKPIELQVWDYPEYREELAPRLVPELQKQLKKAVERERGMDILMQQPPQAVALYSVAEEYLQDRMKEIYRKCQEAGDDGSGGNLVDLGESDVNLIQLFRSYMDSWQEVVLVTESDRTGPRKGVVVNRPRPGRVSSLFEDLPGPPTELMLRFRDVFGQQVLYAGNTGTVENEDGTEAPNKFKRGAQKKWTAKKKMPADSMAAERKKARQERRWLKEADKSLDITILHQYEEAQNYGSTRIAGRILRADDMEGALEAVEALGVKPAHFRIFEGSLEWEPGEIKSEIEKGYWISASASRSLILKHCIGLPKPLWHELMELIGDGALETSELEIRKRREAEPY